MTPTAHRQALEALDSLVESIAEQQAMHDDSWRSRYATIRALLAASPAETPRSHDPNDPDNWAMPARKATAVPVETAPPPTKEQLRSIEWAGGVTVDYEYTVSACPVCDGLYPPAAPGNPIYLEDQHVGHKPDCWFAALVV